jgi:hypothetical protein
MAPEWNRDQQIDNSVRTNEESCLAANLISLGIVV